MEKMVNLAYAESKNGCEIFVMSAETPINTSDIIKYDNDLYEVINFCRNVYAESKEFKFFNKYLKLCSVDPKKIYYNDENFKKTFLYSIGNKERFE